MPRIRFCALTLLTICASLLLVASTSAQNVHNWPTTNGSVTITTGNTFQQLLPSVPTGGVARRSLTIQNNNSASACQAGNTCDLCWIFIGSGTPSTAKSIQLAATQAYTRYYPFVPSDVIQGTCASNSDTIYVDSQ